MSQDPVADLLKRAPMTDAQRADIWDAFESATSPEDFAQRAQTLKVPDTVKADLWDLKANATTQAPVPTPEQPTPPGAAARFGNSLWNAVNPIEAAKGLAKLSGVPGLLREGPIGAVKDQAGIVGNILSAQGEQFGKMVDAAKHGHISEAVGRAGATMLPILGPMAAKAGEQIGEGDVAGGLGTATGVLAPFGVKYAAEARGASNAVKAATKADRLEREAIETVSKRVLAPANQRYRGPAVKVAPELLKRGVSGDRIAIQQWADDLVGDASQKIDAAWNALPPNFRSSTAPILKRLDDELGSMQFSGPPAGKMRVPTKAVNPVMQGRYDELSKLRQFIADRGASLSADDVRLMRQQFDDAAAEAGAFAKTSGDAKLSDAGRASLSSAHAFRQQIAHDIPALVDANADMTLGLTVRDILDPTKGRPSTPSVTTGATGGMHTTGAIVGTGLGKAVGHIPGMEGVVAFVASDLMPRMRNAKVSPANQLRLAQDKFRLAEALKAQKPSVAKSIALKMSMYLKPDATKSSVVQQPAQ